MSDESDAGSKSVDPRPQPEVGVLGQLRLHPDEVLEHRGDAHAGPSQQMLARQERAVQREPIEDGSRARVGLAG